MIIITLFSCKNDVFKYKISDDYTGPCMVFIYPNKKYPMKGYETMVTNGFGAVNDERIDSKFVFQSVKNGKEIEIVEIGKEENVKDPIRYVFRLRNSSFSSDCSKDHLNMVSFYIGKRSDYEIWNKKYEDEIVYFDSIGVDWCNYYKSNLKAN